MQTIPTRALSSTGPTNEASVLLEWQSTGCWDKCAASEDNAKRQVLLSTTKLGRKAYGN